MKRLSAFLLIALLLLCPLLNAYADDAEFITVPEGYLGANDRAELEKHAETVAEMRGVSVYYLCSEADDGGSALIGLAEGFVDDKIEYGAENAVVLAVNPSLYWIAVRGPLAEAVFTESVCDDVLWEAYRAVKGDYPGKIRAYLDAADDVLAAAEATVYFTDSGKSAVIDDAHLLNAAEANTLSRRLVDLGNQYACDLIVVTTAKLGGKSPTEYADDFFDDNGYGYGAVPDINGATVDGDGVLLLIAEAEREYCVSTSGKAIELFDDEQLDALKGLFVPYLNDNEYMYACTAFADGCETVLKGEALPPSEIEPTASPEPTPEPTPMPPVTYTKGGKLPVVDQAGLLRPEDVTALSEKLAAIAEKHRCDIVIVTADGLGYKTATEYADDFFDYNGYGYGAVPDENGVTRNGDGILLLVSMEERDYAISTSGFGITALTDYGIRDLEKRFLPDLSAGNYAQSFNTFADRCDWLLATARKGRPYDVGYYLNPVAMIAAIVGGLLLGFIPVSAMKRQLTDVHQNTNADRYLEPASFVLTQNSDVYLNSHISRTVHVEPVRSSGGGGGHSGGSSTHTSSSGGTHGGHSGKF